MNELKNALQQAEPLKQVVEAANGHLNATIEKLNHRIKDVEQEQSRALSYEVRLADAIETVSRLSEENIGLRKDLKSAAIRYTAAEKQLLESSESIKELKHAVSDLSNRLRKSQGVDFLDDRYCSVADLRRKIAELERELSAGQDELHSANSTIAQLKASKASLQRALSEAEPMRDQLRQSNCIIEQLTARLTEIERDLDMERVKTRNKLRDTVASIDRVNFRLRNIQPHRVMNIEAPSDVASTDILSMITTLNSRLCVLDQELAEQDFRRKAELSPTRRSEKCHDCLMNFDNSLVRRAREEYNLLRSEVAEIETQKQVAAATLKSIDESILEKRKALEQNQLSIEETLSKKLPESKPEILHDQSIEPAIRQDSKPQIQPERKLLIGESSGTKINACKSIQIQTENPPRSPEKERPLSGHGLVWEFNQNSKRIQVPRRKKTAPVVIA